MIQVLDTGIAPAQENMDCDTKLLESLDTAGPPILHFYRWDGLCATFGHFIKLEKHVRLEKAIFHHLHFAKRPTGGGIVFHIWDLAFSFLMPSGHPLFSGNTLDNYRFVNEAVIGAVAKMFCLEEVPSLTAQSFPSVSAGCNNFCMARPTQYDVVYKGLKIAGAAQRKTRRGYLHQGTISLALPDLPLLQSVLLSEQAVFEAMAAYAFAPLGACSSKSELENTRSELQMALYQKFMEKL